ncbi:hypothetical protein BJG94_15105 [Rhizobium sp. Td3]|nr:hypothetical protein BJG94_15105 [Rhizobium sp. Td3]
MTAVTAAQVRAALCRTCNLMTVEAI